MTEVRDTATVRVSSPVDGTPRRRGKDKAPRTTTTVLRVDPEVMAVARRIMRPGERLVIVNETTVRLVPKKHENTYRGANR